MSLTSFLRYNPDVRERFRIECPKPIFSIRKPLWAPPRSNRYALIGTAFDYLFRFYLERLNKVQTTYFWIAELAVYKSINRKRFYRKGWPDRPLPLVKPYVKFSLIRLTDKLHLRRSLATCTCITCLASWYRFLRDSYTLVLLRQHRGGSRLSPIRLYSVPLEPCLKQCPFAPAMLSCMAITATTGISDFSKDRNPFRLRPYRTTLRFSISSLEISHVHFVLFANSSSVKTPAVAWSNLLVIACFMPAGCFRLNGIADCIV